MDDLYDAYIERLFVHLQHPENLAALVHGLDRIKQESGHGEVNLVIADNKLQLVSYKVKQKAAGNGVNPK